MAKTDKVKKAPAKKNAAKPAKKAPAKKSAKKKRAADPLPGMEQKEVTIDGEKVTVPPYVAINLEENQ